MSWTCRSGSDREAVTDEDDDDVRSSDETTEMKTGSDHEAGTEDDEDQRSGDETTEMKTFYVDVPTKDLSTFIPATAARTLTSGWRPYFQAVVSEVWPCCAVVWKNSYFLNKNVAGSRMWKASGICKVEGCVKVLVEGDMTCSQELTRLVIYVTGKCTHRKQPVDPQDVTVVRNRVQLRGERRKSIAQWMLDTGQKPTEVYYKLLAQMSDNECDAGNLTQCQTPKVLKQAVWELEKERHLHQSVVNELSYLMEAFKLTHIGRHIDGYIQDIGIGIFRLPLYIQEQVDAFINDCRKAEGGIIHIDATGSVVARNTCRSQSPIFLYSTVLGRNSLPVFDFLSNRHTADWLTQLFTHFMGDVKRSNGGKPIVPRHVVTDFSYPLMSAVLSIFNSMNIIQYLHFVHDVIHGKVSADSMSSHSFISICCSHMIKATAGQLRRRETDPENRKLALVIFAALQRCHDLHTAKSLYRHAYIVFNSQRATNDVLNSCRVLNDIVVRHELGGDTVEDDEDEDDEDQIRQESADDVVRKQTNRNIKNQSPFTASFGSILPSLCQLPSTDAAANDYYSPGCFKALQTHIHLWPLWSSVTQGELRRFASQSDVEIVPCRSNATVESYFKAIKHGRMGHYTRLRATDFVLRQLEHVLGKVKELKLPMSMESVRRRMKGQPSREKAVDQGSLKWSRRKRSRLYHSKTTRSAAVGKLTATTLPQSGLNAVGIATGHVFTEQSADTPPSHHSTSYDVVCHEDDEMSDTAVDQMMMLLREKFPDVGGLEPAGLGQCEKRTTAVGGSLPRFTPATGAFVQILNVGDHWTCASNVFSSRPDEVHVHDSLFRTVSANTVLQLSSILRRLTDCDTISIHIRDFDVQPHRLRLCGFYAAAAALSICNEVDPSGNRYDVDSLASCISVAVRSKCTDVIVPLRNVGATDRCVVVRRRMHCVCHSAGTEVDMLRCAQCTYQYHPDCIGITDVPGASWLGPCCVNTSTAILSRRSYSQLQEHSEFNVSQLIYTHYILNEISHNKLCERPPQLICPAPLVVYFCAFEHDSNVVVTCVIGRPGLCANNLDFLGFSVPNFCPMHTTDRQTDFRHLSHSIA